MRTTLTILFLSLSGFARAQTLDEVEDPAQLHVIFFSRDVVQIKQAIRENLSALKGVEPDPVTRMVMFQEEEIKRTSSERKQFKSFHENEDKIDEAIIKVSWTPPPMSPQKISNGGGNLVPRPSSIYIKVVNLKANAGAVAVSVMREWIYNGASHVPYTEIPLPRTDSSKSGGIAADEAWVRGLAKPVEELSLPEAQRGSRLVDILEHLPPFEKVPSKPRAK